MTLPQDPFMLLSMVNMKLRDGGYESLDDMCLSLDVDKEEIAQRLHAAGFDYNPDIRQFR